MIIWPCDVIAVSNLFDIIMLCSYFRLVLCWYNSWLAGQHWMRVNFMSVPMWTTDAGINIVFRLVYGSSGVYSKPCVGLIERATIATRKTVWALELHICILIAEVSIHTTNGFISVFVLGYSHYVITYQLQKNLLSTAPMLRRLWAM